MTRPIRAWCDERKKYIKDFFVTPDGVAIDTIELKVLKREDSTGVYYYYNQMAYEGDIIFDAHSELYGCIVFDEGKFTVTPWYNCDELSDILNSTDVDYKGNIKENFELLD